MGLLHEFSAHHVNLVCTLTVSQAQESYIIISGKVLDSKTHVPLGYSSIGLVNKGVGTISNEMGEFEFSVPINYINDSLYISHLGYKTFYETIGCISNCRGDC